MQAEMRLGGMQPACCYEELPKVYHITKILESDNNLLTFFCYHDDKEGKALIWESEKNIRIDGISIPLHYSPSYRNHWCTFTIRPLDIFK